MKLVNAPLNKPFSVSFAHVDVTAPIIGIHTANPIPAKVKKKKIQKISNVENKNFLPIFFHFV